MKVCNECGIEKPIGEFNKNKNAKDGLQYNCKVCLKQHYQENSEYRKQKMKQWILDNKDKHKQTMNKWYNNNKEYMKQYHQNNKDKAHQHAKKHRISKKLSYWIVYQLPNANNYVGQTQNTYQRMRFHKQQKRNSEGWIELHRCNTLQEALTLEAHYFSLGYPGDNASYN